VKTTLYKEKKRGFGEKEISQLQFLCVRQGKLERVLFAQLTSKKAEQPSK